MLDSFAKLESWKMIILVILTIISATLSQFAVDQDTQPDVTFGDHNDRFDVGSMTQQQPNVFYNRDYNDDERSRRRHSDFAYHDNMMSGEGGNLEDFEMNLKAFARKDKESRRLQGFVDFLHGEGPSRRSSGPNPEKEILLHYAVPIDFKIKGYFLTPFDE